MIIPSFFEWHLECTPRDVQVEALLRSFYGFKYHEDDATPLEEPIKLRDGPARGWGHLLEMRLGKTPTMLNEAVLLKTHCGMRKSVFISPNTYKPEWVREAQQFGADLPMEAVETGNFKRELPRLIKAKEWALVVNYEAIRSELLWEFLEGEMDKSDSGLFIDESIKVKNPESQTTKKISRLRWQAGWQRILTGSPMTQGPQDLYAQLRIIGGTSEQEVFWGFRNRYCKMGGFKRKKVVGVREENSDELAHRLSQFAFTAKRKHWGTVKGTEYSIEKVDMTDAQIKLYMQLENEFYALCGEDNLQEVSVEQVITLLNKQQQISSGFVYDDEKNVVQVVKPNEVPKLVRLKAILEDSGDKAIVFYHYNQSGDILAEALKDYNPAFIRAKAWMAKNGYDVLEEKDKFNNDPECRVVIASIEAVKYGNTLVGVEGDRCTMKHYYENTYSMDSRTQTEMRNQAAVQTWDDLCFDYASCPVERNVMKALQLKESLRDAVLGTYRPNTPSDT